VLELADAGSHIIAGDDMYGGTYRLFERVRRRSAGHDFTYVDLTSPENLLAAIKPETKMVWVETPTNPMLKLADLQAIAQICRERGIIAVADNTFASPMVQRPLEHGFDIVVHSATKYLNGHSDIIGGIAVVGGEPHQKAWREQLAFLQNSVGAIAGPFDSFLALRGVKTLAIRMERHCASALALAQWLEQQPKVRKVFYPGLESHPQHALANGRCRASAASSRSTSIPTCRGAPLPRKQSVCAGRKPGRRRKPDRAPGPDDPCHHPAGPARGVGYWRRFDPAVRGN
jgi:cystathionine gamma-lyase